MDVDEGTDPLFIQGDSAYIVQYEPPDATEIRFLGELKGGRYTEQLHLHDKGLDIKMEFEHRRLGRGKALRTGFTQPPRNPGAYLSDRAERTIERGQRLRKTFQRWSMNGS